MSFIHRYTRWQLLPCTPMLCSLLLGLLLTEGQAQDFRVPWILPAAMGWVSPMVDRDGNAVLLGEYAGENLIPHIYGTTQFGDFTLPPLPAGNFSACIAKVDAHGSPLWLRALVTSSLNGGAYPHMSQLTTEGDIVFVGELHGSVTLGGATLQSGGEGGVPLIAKVGQDGDVLWARAMTTPTGSAAAQKVALDPAGSIYVAGQFSSELSLDGQSITAVGGGGFLAKLSPAGQRMWLRELPTAPSVMAVDQLGNTFICAQGQNGMQFGAFTLVTGGVSDAYAAKYSADGTCQWLFGCGSEVSDDGWGLAVNREGYCYLAATAGLSGSTATTVTVGNTTIQAGRSEFTFVVILNPDGEPQAVVPFEGISSFRGGVGSVAVDRHGNAVVLGQARLGPNESAGTLQIGEKSLSLDATLNSALFAANVQPDGICNWLLPLSKFHNTGGDSYLTIQPPASPAMGEDDSMLIAVFTAGTQHLGTHRLNGRFLARIDLPVTKPILQVVNSDGQLRITWPELATGFTLQSATTLEDGGSWQDLDLTPVLEGDEQVVAVDREQFEARFFRLRKP